MNSTYRPFRHHYPLHCISKILHDVSQKLVIEGGKAKLQIAEEIAKEANEGGAPVSYDRLLTGHFANLMVDMQLQGQLHTVVVQTDTTGYVYLNDDPNAVAHPDRPQVRQNIDLSSPHPCGCGHSRQVDYPCPHTLAFLMGERARANCARANCARANCERANQQAPAHVDSHTSNLTQLN